MFLRKRILKAITLAYGAGDEGAPAGGGSGTEEVVVTEGGDSVAPPAGAGDGGGDTPAGGGDGGSGGGSEEAPLYMGSKDVNPNQRPLKNFNREGMTQTDIDRFIEQAGEEIFLAKPASKKVDSGKKDEKGKAPDKKADETPGEFGKEFFETIGLDKEKFLALDEKSQEKVFDLYSKHVDAEKKVKGAEEGTIQFRKEIDQLRSDSVIAARLEELATGKNYVAKDLPQFTRSDIDKIDSLLADNKPDEALKLLNEELARRAADAVTHERGVSERTAQRKSAEKDAAEVLLAMGKIDPRLKVDIALDELLSGLPETHKKHKEYASGLGKVVDFIREKKFSLAQMKELGSEQIYSLYAKHVGWDKARDEAIYKNGYKDFMKRIRESAKGSRNMEPPSSAANGTVQGKTSVVLTHDALVEEVAAGNTANLDRMLEAADGDPKKIAEIGEIRRKGFELYRQNKAQK